MNRRSLFRGEETERAAAKPDDDFSRLRIREKSQVLLALCAALTDGFAADLLKEHTGDTVIPLGA